MELVLERERELAQLDDLQAAVLAGAGQTIVIEGQPGLGKSTLIAATERRARGEALRTISFCCGELEQELPWIAVRGLFQPVADALDGPVRERLFTGATAPAARLFFHPSDGDRRTREVDGYSVMHALFRFVGELTATGPLLLLLDDAHWADRPSLQFLSYLQRRLSHLPLGLVLAMRPALQGAEPDLLERLPNGPDTQVQSLRSLALDSVTALVHEQGFPTAGERFCQGCWQMTAGNPFYLHELLRELHEDHIEPDTDADGLIGIPPPSVMRSVLVRLGRLHHQHAGTVARATAILGDGATLRHIAALSELEPQQVADAVDTLAGAELLEPGEPLRFVHPLVRAAIYADIPVARRALQHARAAELLGHEHAPAYLVALHHLHAPLANSPETVASLRLAADHASAAGAPEGAICYLRRALEEPPPPEARLDVLLELARAETGAGDTAAVEHLTLALELARESEQRAGVLLELGWAEHHAGRFHRAADAFARGLELAAPGELANDLESGYLQSASLDVDRAADAIKRIGVIEAAPRDEQVFAHRELLAQVLFHRTVSGAPVQGIIELAQRLWAGGRLLEEQGADSQAIWHVVGALSWAGAYPQALGAIERVMAAAEEHGFALALARGYYARAWPYYWTARIPEAAADARAAIDIWNGGLETYLPAAVYWLGLCELERGDPAAAQAALEITGERDRWLGSGMLPFLLALEGHIHMHAGRSAEALAAHTACGETLEALMVTSPVVMAWRSEAALALRMLGETERARELVAAELAAARATRAPRPIGVALRTAGICAGGSKGVALFEESVAFLAGSGAHLEHARSLVELGAALRRQGKRLAARPHLEQAATLLAKSGASVLAARADTELRAAGVRSRVPLEVGVDALTASERRVAQLAADGHSNRHIAGLLQISVKAVEWHLHQSYRKLDIKNRRELSAVLAR